MTNKLILMTALLAAFSGSKLFAAGDLGLSSPSYYISDGASPTPTWYVPVVRNSSVTFTVSPSQTLTSLNWTFANTTTATGTGNGPIVVKYDLDSAEGSANPVTFTSVYTGSQATCTTSDKPLLSVVLIDIQYQTTSGAASTSDGDFSTDPENAIVRLKNASFPTEVFNLHCRAKLSAANVLPNDLPVYLVNKSGAVGQLGFSVGTGDATSTTQVVTLPKDGSWAPFNISGRAQSSAIGDAVMEVHKDSTSGPKLGEEDMTVYYFDPSNMIEGLAHSYSIASSVYGPALNDAIDFQVSSFLKPENLSLGAGQFLHLLISFTQNIPATTAIDAQNFDTPGAVTYDSGVATGTVAKVYPNYRVSYNLPNYCNDWASQVPGADSHTYEPSPSTLPRVNSSSTDQVTQKDSPTCPAPSTANVVVYDSSGNPVGHVIYNLKNVTMDQTFYDWAETYDTSTAEIIPLRQNYWTLNANSLDTGGSADQVVTHDDAAVSGQPTTTGASANSSIASASSNSGTPFNAPPKS